MSQPAWFEHLAIAGHASLWILSACLLGIASFVGCAEDSSGAKDEIVASKKALNAGTSSTSYYLACGSTGYGTTAKSKMVPDETNKNIYRLYIPAQSGTYYLNHDMCQLVTVTVTSNGSQSWSFLGGQSWPLTTLPTSIDSPPVVLALKGTSSIGVKYVPGMYEAMLDTSTMTLQIRLVN